MMKNVMLTIHNHQYQIACEAQDEAHLRQLAEKLSTMMEQFAAGFAGDPNRKPAESTLWLLTALTLQDDLDELKKKSIDTAQAANVNNAAMNHQEVEHAIADTLDQVTQRVERLAASV